MNFTDNLAPENDQCHTAKNYMGLQTTGIKHNITRYYTVTRTYHMSRYALETNFVQRCSDHCKEWKKKVSGLFI